MQNQPLFSHRLRFLRIVRNHTQQNMADMLGIALRNYQRYESGSSKPTLDNLVKIADFLKVPTDYLLVRDEYLQSLGVAVDLPPINLQDDPKFQ